MVSSCRVLFDRDTFQLIHILHDNSHCLLTDISGDCGPHIFTERSQLHIIANSHHLQKLFLCITFSDDKLTAGITFNFIITDPKAS